jgi:hypothetical protein
LGCAHLLLGFQDVSDGVGLSSSTFLVQLMGSDRHVSVSVVLSVINFIHVVQMQVLEARILLLHFLHFVLIINICLPVLLSTNSSDFLWLS